MKLKVLFAMAFALTNAAWASDYAVVVSEKTNADANWHRVAETLRNKHKGEIVVYKNSVDDALPALRKSFPRYACFVATPDEAGREFVAQVHRLTRQLDDDIYTDCLWGIVTGYDARAAQRIAETTKPLLIRKAAAGTSIPLANFESGVWYDELKKNKMVRKVRGEQAKEASGPDDTTEALADTFNKENIDMFVTSGHATERDWQIGYAYRNGQFRCDAGNLFGLDTKQRKIPIESSNPKVYLPVGNCLMGHVDGKNAMALSFMNSGGVRQMIGYTDLTWFGYGGWGVLDYFVEQPGRFTLSEAFYANHQALLNRLSQNGLTAQDKQGLEYDRDIVALYGDPAWQARVEPKPSGWEQKLTQRKGVYTLEIKPLRGADSFNLLDANGAQRGGRPIFQLLPQRIGPATIMEGANWKPVIADNFIMLPQPKNEKTIRVKFRAAVKK